MGTYLNPGKQSFQMSVNSEIFVDKSEMISYLNSLVNTQQRFVSVSRPRRFGKTMAADMICAYYDRDADSRELFEGLKLSVHEFASEAEEDGIKSLTKEAAKDGINDAVKEISKDGKKEGSRDSWDIYLGGFDVIRLVMTDFMEGCDSVDDMITYLTDEVTEELMDAYPDVKYGDRISFRTVMSKIYGATKRQFVIVIDEWDAVFRVWKEDKEGQAVYLDFLRDSLKDKAYAALAYMTGILPIKKYGKHSALNMFTEYSMMFPRQLARCSGFTEVEVKDLCGQYGRDFDAVKDWYDGYDVSDVIPPDPDHEETRMTGKSPEATRYSLYSPLSVVEAMITGRIRNYWNKTETYEALAEYIRMDYDGLKDAVTLLMDGGRLKIDTSSYQNDMTTFNGRDDILSLLIHLGYLGYDDEMSEVFIPNKEILDEFKTSTKSSEWTDAFEAYRMSEKLLKATWEKDAEKVAELIERAHDKAANKTYNDEAALSYAIQMAYYAAQKYYTLIPEADSGKGFADLICIPSPKYPDKPALVIELKYDKDASGAIAQIKDRNYPDRLEHYNGNILLVGINYDRDALSENPEFKHHTCVIEQV